MNIGGFIPSSLLDYPTKVCCVVFTQGCNFRCPYCHNPELVPMSPAKETGGMDGVFEFLERRQGLLDAVVVSGGEPTLQKGLVTFLSRVKRMGFLVKLDTNGSRPQVLRTLLAEGYVDFVAMDIKAPLDDYRPHIAADCDPARLSASIEIIMQNAPAYEFRTTCVRPFITPEAITTIARTIRGAQRYALQGFRPGHLLDPEFFTEENPGPDPIELESFQALALTQVNACIIR